MGTLSTFRALHTIKPTSVDQRRKSDIDTLGDNLVTILHTWSSAIDMNLKCRGPWSSVQLGSAGPYLQTWLCTPVESNSSDHGHFILPVPPQLHIHGDRYGLGTNGEQVSAEVECLRLVINNKGASGKQACTCTQRGAIHHPLLLVHVGT